jgi:hypothetical protein
MPGPLPCFPFLCSLGQKDVDHFSPPQLATADSVTHFLSLPAHGLHGVKKKRDAVACSIPLAPAASCMTVVQMSRQLSERVSHALELAGHAVAVSGLRVESYGPCVPIYMLPRLPPRGPDYPYEVGGRVVLIDRISQALKGVAAAA